MKTEHLSPQMTVALVEDHSSARLLVKGAVACVAQEHRLEINVQTFDTPERALEAVRNDTSAIRPDVVVMDFQASSGRLNGWRAAHEIHALTGAEVIIYTANPEVARQQEERWPVRDACILAKPATHQKVTDCLRAAIVRRLELAAGRMPALGHSLQEPR
jgi:CheY-like chemotaxis protein